MVIVPPSIAFFLKNTGAESLVSRDDQRSDWPHWSNFTKAKYLCLSDGNLQTSSCYPVSATIGTLFQ